MANQSFQSFEAVSWRVTTERDELLATKALPNFEEKQNETDSSDQETKNQPYLVFRPIAAVIQANRNRTHVLFHDASRLMNAEDDETDFLTNLSCI